MLKPFKPRDSQMIGYGCASVEETTHYYDVYLEFFICLADAPLELVLTIAQAQVQMGKPYADMQLQRFTAELEKGPHPYPERWYLSSLRDPFRCSHETVRVVEASIPTLQNALFTMFPQAAWVWLNHKFIRPA